jgi:cobalt transporter subunit CbtA
MLGRIFYPGLMAGVIAGLFLFAAQQTELVPMILQAETYENAAPAHGHDQPSAERHDPAIAGGEETAWAPEDGLDRTLYTGLSSVLVSIGFGLVLAGCFALRRKTVTWREGVVWGLAGYVSLHLAPAFGLSPELPTMAGDNLLGRQIWWIATVAGTAGGLAAIAFGRASWVKALGVVLIVAPHVVGAPHVHVDTEVPATLAARFAVATLVVAALFWALLGGLTGYLQQRFAGT